MKTKRIKKYNKKSYRKKFRKRKKSYRKNKFRNLKGKGVFLKSKKQKPSEIDYVVHHHNPIFKDTSETSFMDFTPNIYRKSLMYPSLLDPPPSYFKTTDKKNYDEFNKLIRRQKAIKIECKCLEDQKIELNKDVLYINKLIAIKRSFLTTGISRVDQKKTKKEIQEYISKKNSIEHKLIPKIEKELKQKSDEYRNNETKLETEYISEYNEYKKNLIAYTYNA
jgi:hypothetical protein